MGKKKKNTINIGDFTFENNLDFWERLLDNGEYKEYKEKAMELMYKHYQFYGELNSIGMEYVLRGAKLSCTHGNKYNYLNLHDDHGVYDKDNPVMSCKDCELDVNIHNFGACGNEKFEPLYSEDAPHPIKTVKDRNGKIRYKCFPVLLKEWGHGDINSRAKLFCIDQNQIRTHENDFEKGKKSFKYLNHCIAQSEEYVEEYVQALMTCDNLLCLYGGVITIVENAELNCELVEEIGENEVIEIDEINVTKCSDDLKRFLKSYETGGIRPSVEARMQYLEDGEPALKMYYDSESYPTIGWGHKIEGSGDYTFSNGISKNLLMDTITREEAEDMFQKDISIRENKLNILLNENGLTATQNEYDMLLSMTYNAGIGALTSTKKYPQTVRWFNKGGFKHIEYSKYVLGDITSGRKSGAMNRKADELEILMGINYIKETDDGAYKRIKSENGEDIWNKPKKINELAEIWEDMIQDNKR